MNTTVLLHTGKGMTRAEYEDGLDTFHHISRSQHPFPPGLTLPPLRELPRGGIFAQTTIIGIVREGVAEYSGHLRAALQSPWFFGRYGLVLDGVRPTKFVPLNGALGFFDVSDEIVREALAI